MSEEINKMCSTCENNSSAMCSVRLGCFFPTYVNWEPIGEKKEDTGCPHCENWARVHIGAFCPTCGQALKTY